MRPLRPVEVFLPLAAALLFLYGMTLTAPVIYDDTAHVRDARAFFMPAEVFWKGLLSRDYFEFCRERTYQPLVTILHRFTHDRPPLYRLIGVLLHAFNSLLVFQVGRRLAKSVSAAALAAALFALFPTHTEAVNISSFKGHLLAFSFSLLSLLSWDEATAGDRRALARTYLFYALALLSKETGVCALGLIAGHSLIFSRAEAAKAARHGAGLALLTGVYFLFRFRVLHPPPAYPDVFEHSTVASLAWHLKMLAFPFPLCLERTLQPSAWSWLAPPACLAALWACRRSPPALFCALWIAVALGPYLHFIPFANLNPVADRYLYLPAAGFALLLGRLLSGPAARYGLYALILACGLATARRNGLYRDERELFKQTVACAPNNSRAHWHLGMSFLNNDELPEAKRCFQNVLRLRNSGGAHKILGDIETSLGNTAAAKEHYRLFVELSDSKPRIK
ncbi:MAG: hypothetical protein HYZ74_06385 [Elusimicrobia bacterium]|nr:hypothetical protein [Elusimicrobiota bacterium]